MTKPLKFKSKPDQLELTPKETQVLLWLAHGLTYDEAADKMCISSSTVRKHITNILKKMNAKNTAHAIALAVNWKIIN